MEDQLWDVNRVIARKNLVTAEDIRRTLEQTKQISMSVEQSLASQDDQLRRVFVKVCDANYDLKHCHRKLRSIKSLSGAALNLFSPKPGKKTRVLHQSCVENAQPLTPTQSSVNVTSGDTEFDGVRSDINSTLDSIELGVEELLLSSRRIGKQLDVQNRNLVDLIDEVNKASEKTQSGTRKCI